MKKYLLVCYVLVVAACSENVTEKSGNNIGAAAATPAGNTENGTAGCGQILFFKKGAKIEATTFKRDGTITRKDLTTITDVKTENGITMAKAEVIETTEGKEAGKPIPYTYRCDGKSFYVDISQMLGDLQQANAKLSVSELAFPIDLKEGQVLPDASVTMDMEYGKKKMQTKVTYKDRKVEGKETLTTGAGSWSCLKVSALIEADILGMDEKTTKMMEAMKARQPKMKNVMWYAPDAGVLRFDLYMDNELKSYSQVTAIH